MFMANQQFNECWKITIYGDKQRPLLAEIPQGHDGMHWSSWQGMSHSISPGAERGDSGGGAVPSHTWAEGQKDTGTKGHRDSPAAQAGLSLLQLPKSPKSQPWENSFEKRRNFEDDVNFDFLNF